MGLNRYCMQGPFLHQNLNSTVRFTSSNLNLEIKESKFYINGGTENEL